MDISYEELEDIVASNANAAIEFWADNCPLCRQFAQIFEDAEKAHPEIIFMGINASKHPFAASKYRIMSAPTTLIFKEGKLVNKVNGVVSLTKFEDILSASFKGE